MAPATAADTKSSHSGARTAAQASRAAMAADDTAQDGPMTRDCPRRSTRRARAGAQHAVAMMLTADTAPARA